MLTREPGHALRIVAEADAGLEGDAAVRLDGEASFARVEVVVR